MDKRKKAAFGYPSRTAAMWAFIEQGDTCEDIARKFGICASDVRVYLGYRRGRFYPSRPGRYLVDRSGALHPCRTKSFEAVALVAIRPNAINETTTADITTADRAGGCEGRAPEGSSGPAVGEANRLRMSVNRTPNAGARRPPPGKIDLNAVPSAMERLANSWRKPAVEPADG